MGLTNRYLETIRRWSAVGVIACMSVIVLLLSQTVASNRERVTADKGRNREVLRAYYDNIIDRSGNVLRIFDHGKSSAASWKDFAISKKTDLANRNINASLVPGMVDGIWIFNTNGTLKYAASTPALDPIRYSVLPLHAAENLIARPGYTHCYVDCPNGLAELYGTSIFKNDRNGSDTHSIGYLIAGRLWTKSSLEDISKLTGSTFEFSPPSGSADNLTLDGKNWTLSRELPSWNQMPLETMRVTGTLDEQHGINQSVVNSILIAVGLAVVGALMGFVCFRTTTIIKTKIVTVEAPVDPAIPKLQTYFKILALAIAERNYAESQSDPVSEGMDNSPTSSDHGRSDWLQALIGSISELKQSAMQGSSESMSTAFALLVVDLKNEAAIFSAAADRFWQRFKRQPKPEPSLVTMLAILTLATANGRSTEAQETFDEVAYDQIAEQLDQSRITILDLKARLGFVEEELSEKQSEINALRDENARLQEFHRALNQAWGRAMDERQLRCAGQSVRVVDLTMRIARRFNLSEEELLNIELGAQLYDIGSTGIPDAILLKSENLTDDERYIMQMHTVYAHELLKINQTLKNAIDIPYSHHERWNGTGYPQGLQRMSIPLAARIFAIADVAVALSSDRPHRKAWPREKVMEHIASSSGKDFDPEVVTYYLEEEVKEFEGQNPDPKTQEINELPKAA